MEDFIVWQSVLKRFLRGALAGAVGSIATISVFGGNSLVDLEAWLTALLISGISGAIAGGVLALDKYLRVE